MPPVLAVEVVGTDDGDSENALREKAKWYLSVGVSVVWLLLPERREVIVISSEEETRYAASNAIEAHPALPELSPKTSELFVQIGSRT